MARRCQLGRQEARQSEVRDRIIRATIELHASGPASVAAITARARVGRATLHRHFPDERSLILACTASVFADHPLPDPAGWANLSDPEQRLRRALTELYGYYGDLEPLLASAEVVAATNASLREGLAPLALVLAEARAELADGWPDSAEGRSQIGAAIAHATAFATWRSLTREQGLIRNSAVELMVSFVSATVRKSALGPPGIPPSSTEQGTRLAT